MSTKFKIGDKVILKKVGDGKYDNHFTIRLNELFKCNNILVVRSVDYSQIGLIGDDEYMYSDERFKKYNEFELEEELFIVWKIYLKLGIVLY